MNPLLLLKVSAAGQALMAFMLIQEATNINTTIGGITAFGTFANLVVLVGLIYKVGRYTGTTDMTIDGMEKSISSLAKAEEKIMDTQEKHGLSLVELKTDSKNMQADLKIVRDRQHEFASILSQFTLQQVQMKPIPERREPRTRFIPGSDTGQ